LIVFDFPQAIAELKIPARHLPPAHHVADDDFRSAAALLAGSGRIRLCGNATVTNDRLQPNLFGQ